MPKNAASNNSMSSTTPAARTYAGRANIAGLTPVASKSASVNLVIELVPLQTFFQSV